MGKRMICWKRAKSGDHHFQLEDFLAWMYLADGGAVISGLQASPLLCLTMMGFPECWLESATPSSRKSQRSSSSPIAKPSERQSVIATPELEFDTADCTWASVGNTLSRTFDRNDYSSFIASKSIVIPDAGFAVSPADVNPLCRPWQSDVIRFALRKGRCGVFPDTGLGKTLMQLEIAHHIYQRTGGNILILAPLAVGRQTIAEAKKFGIASPIKLCHSQESVEPGITVTNYEKLHRFDVSQFVCIILDEGSILKSIDGATRELLITLFRRTPYRFIFTATPSPNDITEIGSYCEFLGIMSRAEMLATYFTHDGGDTSKWRLRKWAENDFFRWMASWSVMFRRPSDLGYEDAGYNLPPLHIHEHVVDTPVAKGLLFQSDATTLHEQRAARRDTIQKRVDKLMRLINNATPQHAAGGLHSCDPWIVWCNLNDESTAATQAIRDSTPPHIKGVVEVRGSMKDYEKELALIDFTDGLKRAIVTKPEIAGFGLNWQHCNNMAFMGLSHSYEQFYQATKRIHRFGQQSACNVHVIVSDRDGAVLANINRKQAEADRLVTGMIQAMADVSRAEIGSSRRETVVYQPQKRMEIPRW